jgi:hypothetical protein
MAPTYRRLALSVGTGGWVGCVVDDAAPFYVRFALDEHDRLAPTELHLAPGTTITTLVLQRLPLVDLDLEVNEGPARQPLLDRLHDDAPNPVAALAATMPEPTPRAPVRLVTSAVLVQPDQRPYPDKFYRAVARLYRRLARTTNRPAAVIAEANSVPLTTAHRWIKEARKRGHLPPGQKGRRG